MTNLSPWRRPGAGTLHQILGGDPKKDNTLATVVETLDALTLQTLAGMVASAVTNARTEAFQQGFNAGTAHARAETSDAYERGFAEGVEHGQAGGAP